MKQALNDLKPLMPGLPAFSGLLVAVVVSAGVMAFGSAFLDAKSLVPTMLRVMALLGLIGLVLWRTDPGNPLAQRLVMVLCGITFLVIAWDAIRILNHATMTLDLSFGR